MGWAWLGSDWICLDWIGWAGIGLAWLSLAWLGLAWLDTYYINYKYCTYNCGDQYNMLYLDIQSVMSLMLGHELPYAARAREATFEWGPPPEFHGPIDQLGARRSPLAADRASLVSPFASLGQAPARRPPSRTAGPPTSSPSSSPARRRATSRRT